MTTCAPLADVCETAFDPFAAFPLQRLATLAAGCDGGWR